jgi:hypothetical protein
MGATSSHLMNEYCGEYGADKNYQYYSGERFCVIPNHFYPRPEDADDGYTWYIWQWR